MFSVLTGFLEASCCILCSTIQIFSLFDFPNKHCETRGLTEEPLGPHGENGTHILGYYFSRL